MMRCLAELGFGGYWGEIVDSLDRTAGDGGAVLLIESSRCMVRRKAPQSDATPAHGPIVIDSESARRGGDRGCDRSGSVRQRSAPLAALPYRACPSTVSWRAAGGFPLCRSLRVFRPLVCLRLLAIAWVLGLSPRPTSAVVPTRWGLPSNLGQYFGYGFGPGYHAPRVPAEGASASPGGWNRRPRPARSSGHAALRELPGPAAGGAAAWTSSGPGGAAGHAVVGEPSPTTPSRPRGGELLPAPAAVMPFRGVAPTLPR